MSGATMNSLNVERRPVVEQCAGCDRIEQGGQNCSAFAYPETKWRLGQCSMATHIKSETAKGGDRVRVGQQKQKAKK